MENNEEYAEVDSEDYYYEDEDFGFNDAFFVIFIVALVCVVFAFVVRTISKHLKSVKFKVGAVELGVETKEDKKIEDKHE